METRAASPCRRRRRGNGQVGPTTVPPRWHGAVRRAKPNARSAARAGWLIFIIATRHAAKVSRSAIGRGTMNGTAPCGASGPMFTAPPCRLWPVPHHRRRAAGTGCGGGTAPPTWAVEQQADRPAPGGGAAPDPRPRPTARPPGPRCDPRPCAESAWPAPRMHLWQLRCVAPFPRKCQSRTSLQVS
jgi:hypothetical protein